MPNSGPGEIRAAPRTPRPPSRTRDALGLRPSFAVLQAVHHGRSKTDDVLSLGLDQLAGTLGVGAEACDHTAGFRIDDPNVQHVRRSALLELRRHQRVYPAVSQ